jgi:hypothetical protein
MTFTAIHSKHLQSYFIVPPHFPLAPICPGFEFETGALTVGMQEVMILAVYRPT